MPEIINWQQSDLSSVVYRVLEVVAAGQLVGFPRAGGCDVAACALVPEGVARLSVAVGQDSPLTVALDCHAQALDWVPGLSLLGQRLGRRGWPGPLTLECPGEVDQGLASRLPGPVRQRLWADGALRLRVPQHQILRLVCRFLAGPLLLAEVCQGSGEPNSPVSQDLTGPWETEVALLLENGPLEACQEVSVVRVQGSNWQMVREGALSAEAVAAMTPCRILFVCTGNTCRSPLAQALCVKLLAQHLGCAAEELPQQGYIVQSAGLAARRGCEASPEAVAIAGELGADLSGHRSQPLTVDLLAQADYVFAMTHNHLQALLGHDLPGCPTPRLLSANGQDVSDPMGGSSEVYRECAHQILQYLYEVMVQLHPV